MRLGATPKQACRFAAKMVRPTCLPRSEGGMNIGTMIRRSRLAFGLWVIVVLLEAPGAILGLQNPTWPLVFVLLGVFSYPALGAFLAARRPDNPLG